MAIPMPGRDKVPDGPVRDFVSAVHKIYDAATQPPVRLIADATVRLPAKDYQSVSHETVGGILRGGVVPAWEKVRSMLKVLADLSPEHDDPDPEPAMRILWTAARHEMQETLPLVPVGPLVTVEAPRRRGLCKPLRSPAPARRPRPALSAGRR